MAFLPANLLNLWAMPPAPKSAAVSPDLLTSRENRWLKAIPHGPPRRPSHRRRFRRRRRRPALSKKLSGPPAASRPSSSANPAKRHRERLAPLIAAPTPASPSSAPPIASLKGIAATEHPQGVAALVQPRKILSRRTLRHSPRLLRSPYRRPRRRPRPRQRRHDPAHRRRLWRHRRRHFRYGTERHRQPLLSQISPRLAGAALHLPIVAGLSLAILLTQLKLNGIHCPRLLRSRRSRRFVLRPWQVDWCQPIALLVGNEGAGLPRRHRSLRRRPHPHPMATYVESLNAAAAAAVLFYESLRQRQKH